MSFQDVAFHPPVPVLTTHFFKIIAKIKVSEQPHGIKVVAGVGKETNSAKKFAPVKILFISVE